MEKIINYMAGRYKGSDLSFAIDKKGAVGLQEGGAQTCLLSSAEGSHRVLRLGGWLVERFRGSVYLKDTGGAKKLEINFQEGEVKAALTFVQPGGTKKRVSFERVTLITVEGGRIAVQTAGGGDEPLLSSPEGGGAAGNGGAEMAALLRKLEKAEKERDGFHAEIQRLRSENLRLKQEEIGKAHQQSEALEQELAKEREANRKLQEALAEKTSERMEKLDGLQVRLSMDLAFAREELRKKEEASRLRQEEVQKACREKERCEEELRRLDGELAKLREETDRVQSAQEVRTLDCGEARERLQELRSQLSFDEETVQLLADGPLLTCSSVRSALEEIARKLEETEEKIGLVIRVRERIDRTVQDAVVLSGDGTVPAGKETG